MPRRESLQPNPTYAAIAQSEPSGKDTWFLDSCCGQHMCSSGRFAQREHQLQCEEFKLYHGKGGLYIGKAVLKNNVFVLDFVPDLGTADSDGIVTFTSWTHPPDLDPYFSPEGFWYSHTIPEAERTRALATIQHSAAAETTPATVKTTAAAAATLTPIAGPSTASAQIDDTSPTPAQQLNPTPREVHRSANFTASLYSNSDLVAALRLSSCPPPPPLFLCSRGEEGMGVAGVGALGQDRDPTGGFRGDRHFASAADEADWDEQNVDNTSEEFHCFAADLPHLVSTLTAPEGVPDAPDIPTPRSYAEAIEGPYSSQWQSAMDAEMASWKSTGTYVDEVPPPGANIGVDYFQTFSPTPKMTTLRVLLHVAAQRDYDLHSLDFSTAFVQGSLHEEIWLRRPPGFTGSFPPGTQWSLQRPVYGLRQAPHEWHDTLRTTLAALGFAPATADPSLFLRTDTFLPLFYILVYVDDLVFASADTAGLAHVKSELQKRHTCTDLGELHSYLGLQITRDRAQRTITLTQSHMVQQVLQRFDFTYSSPQATPLSTRHSLSALPSDESVEPSGPYPELVGCLIYLMTCTRPDLAYPLSILARYVAPGRHRPEHMAAAKRVLRYLCSTSGLGLVLGGRSPVVLTGHADASWVDDLATQRSLQGYTFSLGSGSVSWRSTRSSSVLSSSFLYVDNKAMLALCQEHRLEHRTKHIALRYFLARELQQRGQLRLAYVASEANTADIFTKALPPGDHQRFCTMLGLVPTWPHLLTS
ncbi:unnamed protein product [Closterium sp. NIES-54]